jgi:K+-sensing histidine kinase KdpD
MFKSILVAVDGSTHAKAAVEYGARLAAKLGARVELLHVIERRLLVGDFITHFTEVLRHKIDGSFADWVESYYSDALARGTATETILRLSQIPALIKR